MFLGWHDVFGSFDGRKKIRIFLSFGASRKCPLDESMEDTELTFIMYIVEFPRFGTRESTTNKSLKKAKVRNTK